MAQNFIDDFSASDTLSSHPDRLDTNFAATRSNFSGTSFPSSPIPVPGQTCWRTDRGLDVEGGGKTGRMYKYTGNVALGESGWVIEEETSLFVQEVQNSRGTKNTMDQRLDVSLNEDGTLKSSVAAYQSEWILPSLTFAYLSTTSFTTSGNTTDIYLATRRLKINLLSSVAFSEVVSSSYNSGLDTTTVNIASAVLDNTLVSVQHSIISSFRSGSGGSLSFYTQSQIDTKARLWQNRAITHNITSDANYTLTTTQNGYGRIIITDTGVLLTTGRNITIDTTERSFIFQNNTAQTLTVKTSVGTGIAVPSSSKIWLINDGVNVVEGLNIKGFNKTTLNGYGITDAYTKTELDEKFLRRDTPTTQVSKMTFETGANGTFESNTSSLSKSIEIISDANNDAMMTFHVGGDYAIHFGIDASTNSLSVGGWSAGAASYKIWHSGNDGSGSGLDADKLDGYDSSVFAKLASPAFTGTPTTPTQSSGDNSTKIASTAFVKSVALQDIAHSFSGNGYQKLSNGLIIQWGSCTYSCTFPISFPNAALQAVVTQTTVTDMYQNLYISTLNTTTITARSTNSASIAFRWLAIGY